MNSDELRAIVEAEKRAIETSLAEWQANLTNAQQALLMAQRQIMGHQVDLKRLEWLLAKLGTEAGPVG